MFTKEQIELAHAKVKSGTDFPKYIKQLKNIGVKINEIIVSDGSWIFKGDGEYSVTFKRGLESVPVSDVSSSEKFKDILSKHQNGETDYLTFCIQAGEVGVEKWITDLDKMTVAYLDKTGAVLCEEDIPTVE